MRDQPLQYQLFLLWMEESTGDLCNICFICDYRSGAYQKDTSQLQRATCAAPSSSQICVELSVFLLSNCLNIQLLHFFLNFSFFYSLPKFDPSPQLTTPVCFWSCKPLSSPQVCICSLMYLLIFFNYSYFTFRPYLGAQGDLFSCLPGTAISVSQLTMVWMQPLIPMNK